MRNATPIPNTLFDRYLPILKPTETHVLLIIFRQTIGWTDHRTGGRKQRDWITNSQFQLKTGLSDKTVTNAIDSLVRKQLIKVTDFNGNVLDTAEERRGKVRIFYAPKFKTSVNNPL